MGAGRAMSNFDKQNYISHRYLINILTLTENILTSLREIHLWHKAAKVSY